MVASPSSAFICCRDLHMGFDAGAVIALAGVSIEVGRGEFLAITGPSGCGKSTLINLLGLLDAPTSGELYLDSMPYSRIRTPSLFRRQQFGFVFQSFHLIPTLSVLDNVMVPTIGTRGTQREHRRRAVSLLARLGLERRLAHFPNLMSGGERQRVAIARALVNDPKTILADEPTGSLDSANAAQVLDMLVEARRERGLTLVVVTHDAAVAARADRVVGMRDGVVVADSEAGK